MMEPERSRMRKVQAVIMGNVVLFKLIFWTLALGVNSKPGVTRGDIPSATDANSPLVKVATGSLNIQQISYTVLFTYDFSFFMQKLCICVCFPCGLKNKTFSF